MALREGTGPFLWGLAGLALWTAVGLVWAFVL